MTEGGEINFISKMIEDSLSFQDRVAVFTTLIGRKQTLPLVLKKLESLEPGSGISVDIRQTTFYQGKTLRYTLLNLGI